MDYPEFIHAKMYGYNGQTWRRGESVHPSECDYAGCDGGGDSRGEMMTKTEKPRLYCSDLIERFNLPDECCLSCHQDQDMGYSIIDGELDTGEEYVCCCEVYHALERIGKEGK